MTDHPCRCGTGYYCKKHMSYGSSERQEKNAEYRRGERMVKTKPKRKPGRKGSQE